MSGKITAFSNGKIITFDKPIVSKIKKIIKDLPKEETVKYTFADAITGFHTEATMQDVIDCLQQLEEEWSEMGTLAWTDLWWGISCDKIPMMSLVGGEERAYILKDGEPKRGFYVYSTLGWSLDYLLQDYGEDADIEPLHFELVWDEENNLYWITPNHEPIIGYMEY